MTATTSSAIANRLGEKSKEYALTVPCEFPASDHELKVLLEDAFVSGSLHGFKLANQALLRTSMEIETLVTNQAYLPIEDSHDSAGRN